MRLLREAVASGCGGAETLSGGLAAVGGSAAGATFGGLGFKARPVAWTGALPANLPATAKIESGVTDSTTGAGAGALGGDGAVAGDSAEYTPPRVTALAEPSLSRIDATLLVVAAILLLAGAGFLVFGLRRNARRASARL